MSSKPLVSSIIIFLNAERFIQEAIESVFAQSYDNWELLLVDDGSTDGSTQIALRNAERYPEKVRYLEHPAHRNRGMSASRNLGVGHARGKYVAFLDSDDVWLADKLQQQVSILETYPEAGVVYGLSQYWYSWTGRPEESRRDFVPELGVEANTLFRPPALLSLLYPLGDATPPGPSNFMVRREVLERTGGFEETFGGIYQTYEDQAFLVKVYLKEPVFSSGQCWDRYRQHPEQYTTITKKAGQHHSARLFFLGWLDEYLAEQRFEDAEVWRLIQQEQRFARVRVHAQKGEWRRVMGGVLALLRYHPWSFFARARRRLATRS